MSITWSRTQSNPADLQIIYRNENPPAKVPHPTRRISPTMYLAVLENKLWILTKGGKGA